MVVARSVALSVRFSGAALSGGLAAELKERLLCSFEEPEIDQMSKWAFRTKKLSDQLYQIEREQYGGVKWHIARDEASRGE